MSSHYNFRRNHKGGYISFKTDNDIQYRCVFTTHKVNGRSSYFDLILKSSIYTFRLTKMDDGIKKSLEKFDVKIGNTVSEILKQFFTKNPNSIIEYICDDSDLKAVKRQKVFTRWFKKNRDPELSLLQAEISNVVYIGFILNKKNKEKATLETYLIENLEVFKQENKNYTLTEI